ncbi:MAG TPA: hypothetical protein VF753_21220, partial [Terriglobales bacterium]
RRLGRRHERRGQPDIGHWGGKPPICHPESVAFLINREGLAVNAIRAHSTQPLGNPLRYRSWTAPVAPPNCGEAKDRLDRISCPPNFHSLNPEPGLLVPCWSEMAEPFLSVA